jgi:hypothetical protein
MPVLQQKHSNATAPSKALALLKIPYSCARPVVVLQTSTIQFSNLLKSLLAASAILVPSIAAGPTPLEALAKREDCCDPNFFFP